MRGIIEPPCSVLRLVPPFRFTIANLEGSKTMGGGIVSSANPATKDLAGKERLGG